MGAFEDVDTAVVVVVIVAGATSAEDEKKEEVDKPPGASRFSVSSGAAVAEAAMEARSSSYRFPHNVCVTSRIYLRSLWLKSHCLCVDDANCMKEGRRRKYKRQENIVGTYLEKFTCKPERNLVLQAPSRR